MVVKRFILVLCIAAVSFASSTTIAEPLHVYLTYSGAPESSIDINVVETKKTKKVEVFYDTVSRGDDTTKYAHHARAKYKKTELEKSDGRTMHVAAIKRLQPATTYYFTAGNGEFGYTKERSFRTLPGGSAPFRFVDGGDMGVDGNVFPLLKLAAQQSPDFVVIGGDIAYEEELSGFATWDKWLNNWEELMITPDGRSIPLVLAIGNHEVRDDGDTLEERSPWYVGLFGRQGKHVYHDFQVGDNAVFFLLDSSHVIPHAGDQATWLKRELKKARNTRYKFAAYHVPLYPAYRPFDGAGSKLGRTHWGPLFDQYGLTVSFEHHDHVLKRTKPLKAGAVVDKGQGTIYLGDGCFGREAREVEPVLRWYNDEFKPFLARKAAEEKAAAEAK